MWLRIRLGEDRLTRSAEARSPIRGDAFTDQQQRAAFPAHGIRPCRWRASCRRWRRQVGGCRYSAECAAVAVSALVGSHALRGVRSCVRDEDGIAGTVVPRGDRVGRGSPDRLGGSQKSGDITSARADGLHVALKKSGAARFAARRSRACAGL